MFGKENKKRELISRLPEIYIQLQREYHISAGDFPKVKAMQVRRPITASLVGLEGQCHLVPLVAGFTFGFHGLEWRSTQCFRLPSNP